MMMLRKKYFFSKRHALRYILLAEFKGKRDKVFNFFFGSDELARDSCFSLSSSPSRVSRMKKEKKYKASNVNWCKAQRSNLYSFICLVQWEIHSCSPPFNFFATKLKTQEFTDPKPLLGKSESFNFKVANLGRNRIGNFKHFGSKDM